jgi:hypothetical protein
MPRGGYLAAQQRLCNTTQGQLTALVVLLCFNTHLCVHVPPHSWLATPSATL